MGTSDARRQRREQEKKEREAVASPPAPEAAPRSAPPQEAKWEPQEINFLVPPGTLLRPEGAPPLAKKAKTVPVPGPMAMYVGDFQNRHGIKRFSFIRVTLAMWRLLLREEHQALERARRAANETGLPAQPRMGPLYQKVLAEMEEMRLEESGNGF